MIKIIIQNVKNKIPTSIIRKSDGENIIIGYGQVKGIRLKKYLKKLRHFNISYFDFSFQKYLKKELLESYYNADYIGVPIKEKYFGYTSSVRKFETQITNHFNFNRNKLVDNHYQLEFIKNKNNDILKNSLAQELISNKKIGLITHFNLSDFLYKFNSEVICQNSIPKRDLRSLKIKMNKLKYNEIINFISKNQNNVDLWLLAAGVYAKPFSNCIKKYGGVAIDLGSAIDTWNNEYHSRKFLRNLIKDG